MVQKIAVIDDSKEFRHLIKNVLEHAGGFEVHTFFSAIDFLGTELSSAVDLLVLDIDMPMVKGDELFKHLRSVGFLASTPVLIVTGFGEDFFHENLEPYIDSHEVLGVDFLQKPVSTSWLKYKINFLLRLKALVEENRQYRTN